MCVGWIVGDQVFIYFWFRLFGLSGMLSVR